MLQKGWILAAAVVVVLAESRGVQAAFVVGGGGLMTQSYAEEVEIWLGEGPVQFTNIFTKASGDDADDFHDAANHMGRTITLIEVLAGDYPASDPEIGEGTAVVPYQVIGGYNPFSWKSDGTYNSSPSGAFIFNLTYLERMDQDGSFGEFQTYNSADTGPVFGGGFGDYHDIFVDFTLNSGHSYDVSYGAFEFTDSIVHTANLAAYYVEGIQFGQIEVYSIAAAVEGVPEPASMAIWGIGFGCVALMISRRRRLADATGEIA